jgi:hypothetical protein
VLGLDQFSPGTGIGLNQAVGCLSDLLALLGHLTVLFRLASHALLRNL